MKAQISDQAKKILATLRPANMLRDVVMEIASARGIDLSKTEGHTRVDNEPYQRLCIEAISDNTISVAHYYEMNGDLVPDPDMVFLVENGNWYPISFQNQMKYEDAVKYDGNGQIIAIMNNIRSMVLFSQMWAKNIKEQGFLEAAKETESPS